MGRSTAQGARDDVEIVKDFGVLKEVVEAANNDAEVASQDSKALKDVAEAVQNDIEFVEDMKSAKKVKVAKEDTYDVGVKVVEEERQIVIRRAKVDEEGVQVAGENVDAVNEEVKAVNDVAVIKPAQGWNAVDITIGAAERAEERRCERREGAEEAKQEGDGKVDRKGKQEARGGSKQEQEDVRKPAEHNLGLPLELWMDILPMMTGTSRRNFAQTCRVARVITSGMTSNWNMSTGEFGKKERKCNGQTIVTSTNSRLMTVVRADKSHPRTGFKYHELGMVKRLAVEMFDAKEQLRHLEFHRIPMLTAGLVALLLPKMKKLEYLGKSVIRHSDFEE